ncbi:hypothetical protein CBL_05576 [Carabus blaptoides fortunei]
MCNPPALVADIIPSDPGMAGGLKFISDANTCNVILMSAAASQRPAARVLACLLRRSTETNCHVIEWHGADEMAHSLESAINCASGLRFSSEFHNPLSDVVVDLSAREQDRDKHHRQWPKVRGVPAHARQCGHETVVRSTMDEQPKGITDIGTCFLHSNGKLVQPFSRESLNKIGRAVLSKTHFDPIP